MFTTMGWLLASFSITLVIVRVAIGYAHRRGMLDQPGQRRSHYRATPRGGGIGIVLAMLVYLLGVGWRLSGKGWWHPVPGGLWVALVLVALAGWWDDHRSLPVLPRLGAQVLGTGLFALSLLATGTRWWWLPLLLGGGVWSINLHNFMDGIDGLLAQQGIFVGVGVALLAWAAAQPELALVAACMAVSTLGFWCFNRPPARVFMGDVGSGSMGLLIFAFSAMLWQVDPELLWPALILSSAFVVDASLTLLTRMWYRRRWYAAHREHLYQWLARRSGTHARVDAAYLGWNLLVAAPLAWLAWSHLHAALAITMVAYLGAATIWLYLKRRLLRRSLSKAPHVTA
ncbi:MAG: glycosyltransferase family 4 protein [Rhodanobacter sp.]|nr:MAG: glycosyltransferase family 4 protein [Rhodanobacter sp.]TAM05489.1 MAG: glycosyltransferase family 4 protein [Rhodanobacter sp.]TAM42407.1 MAG: glycosyltransferase family 4 protein [Rhodanobacter sp.]